MILPIGGVHRGTLTALRYARALSDDVTAVYVSIDPEEAEKVRAKWEMWGDGVRLVILESPYRLLLEPLLQYIEKMAAHAPAERDHHHRRAPVRAQTLVAQLAAHADGSHIAIGAALQAGIVITDVPYQVRVRSERERLNMKMIVVGCWPRGGRAGLPPVLSKGTRLRWSTVLDASFR